MHNSPESFDVEDLTSLYQEFQKWSRVEAVPVYDMFLDLFFRAHRDSLHLPDKLLEKDTFIAGTFDDKLFVLRARFDKVGYDHEKDEDFEMYSGLEFYLDGGKELKKAMVSHALSHGSCISDLIGRTQRVLERGYYMCEFDEAIASRFNLIFNPCE